MSSNWGPDVRYRGTVMLPDLPAFELRAKVVD